MKCERFLKTGEGRKVVENLLKEPATKTLAGQYLRND
jgi:hypothetical protein